MYSRLLQLISLALSLPSESYTIQSAQQGGLHHPLHDPLAAMRGLATLLLVALAVPACAQVGSTALFSDEFGRSAGLGTNWSVPLGSFTTDGNKAVSGMPSGSGNWAALVPPVGTNNYAVVADIAIPSGSTFSGIVARSSIAGNFDHTLYSAQISSSGAVSLYRRNGWSWTQLGTVAAGIVAGTQYRLALVTTGSSPVHLEVWLNNTKRISYDDSSASRILEGIPGIENYDAGVKYNSFTVYSWNALFRDDFVRTTGLGNDWNAAFGNFTTPNGREVVSGTPSRNGNWAALIPQVGTNDYSVVADIVIPPGSTYSGVFARSSVAGNCDETLYAAQISANGSVNLFRRNGWSWTLLNSVAAGIVAGTKYTLGLVTFGSSPVHLEVWLNGTRLLSFDDSSASRIASGIPGIETYDANVRYDSFAVYSWSGAGSGGLNGLGGLNGSSLTYVAPATITSYEIETGNSVPLSGIAYSAGGMTTQRAYAVSNNGSYLPVQSGTYFGRPAYRFEADGQAVPWWGQAPRRELFFGSDHGRTLSASDPGAFKMGETVAFRGSVYMDSSTYKPDASTVYDAHVQWHSAANAAGEWYGAMLQLGNSTYGGLSTPSIVFGVANSWDPAKRIYNPGSGYNLPLTQALDRWVDWYLLARFSAGPEGFYIWYVDGRKVAEYHGVTLSASTTDGSTAYYSLQQGMYTGSGGWDKRLIRYQTPLMVLRAK